MTLVSCVPKVADGILGPTLIGADARALSIVVHGWEHQHGEDTEEPEHGEHEVLVGDHTEPILVEGVAFDRELLLLVLVLVILIVVVIIAVFLAFKESPSLFCLSLVLPDTYDLEDWENLLERCVQEIVIIGYQLLGAVYLLTMVIIRPPFIWNSSFRIFLVVMVVIISRTAHLPPRD